MLFKDTPADKLQKLLPKEAEAKMVGNKIRVAGKFSSFGDWDHYLNPFKDPDKLLNAIKEFKGKNPDIEIVVASLDGGSISPDGRISVFVREDDGWDINSKLKTVEISQDFEKYATFDRTNFKDLSANAKRIDVPSPTFQKSTKKPIPRYEDTLLKNISDLNDQTMNSFFNLPKTPMSTRASREADMQNARKLDFDKKREEFNKAFEERPGLFDR